MIRVLHVIDSFDLGGAQTVILNLVRAMDQSEFEVEVAAMHGTGPFQKRLEATGLKVHSLSSAKWPPHYIWNYVKLLKAGRYDVVHFHLFGANWIAKPLTALTSDAVRIVHDHCNDALRYDQLSALLMDSATNRLSDYIYCVSESTRKFLIEFERLPEERMSVLENAVDTDEFSPTTTAARMQARGTLGIAPDSFVVGGVGRLVPQKDFELFVDVAATCPDLEFVIAGTGPLEAHLRERAGANVRFLGYQEDRKTLYAAMDALLLTSRFEGMPMTVLEAMASGVAVVSACVDGVAEAFGAGEVRLVNSREEKAFASELRLLFDPEQRQNLTQKARLRIERDFSISQMADTVMDRYRREVAIAQARTIR